MTRAGAAKTTVRSVISGKVDAPNAPILHWREYNTTSRRTSLVIDPPNGRLPPRTPAARPVPVQRCGSLARGEPCDSYEDYGLGVRCIVHGGGFPDAMFPAVYNANFRIVQAPGDEDRTAWRRHRAPRPGRLHDRPLPGLEHLPQPVVCRNSRRSLCTSLVMPSGTIQVLGHAIPREAEQSGKQSTHVVT